jgi:long-chain acyl-CoA synthetase
MRVRNVAASLEAQGLGRGDRAGILSENRPEWAITDYGCLCAGVEDVPIYSTLTAPQVAYVLKDSGVKLLFVSTPQQMEKAVEARRESQQKIRIVVYDAPSVLPDEAMSWKAFLEAGAAQAAAVSEEEFKRRALQARPEDVATMLYTSGTTGQPKGVMLTHGNIGSNTKAVGMIVPLGPDDVSASFLPLCHILQRTADFLFFFSGCVIAYPRSMQTVVDDLPVIRPTVAVSVPRFYEKIYGKVTSGRGLKKVIVDWALRVAGRSADIRLEGGRPAGLLALQYSVADRLVFSKVRSVLGGRIRFFVSGGGALAPALNRFFYSIGITILEGYGLTETSPVTNLVTLDSFRIGTVGRPVPNTEIRIAGDGEILVRGPQVMKGYLGRPEDTAAAIDAQGWFHTGDIGEIDDDDHLRITDRKKDLIVTAGGKNVAPQPIENRLASNPFVEQAVMVGEGRKFISVLVVPKFAPLEAWAKEQGIPFASRADLVRDARVRKHMEGQIKQNLSGLASFESPKKVALLDEELTIQNGFLTPTLKIKRKVVQERFKDMIDGLYEDGED